MKLVVISLIINKSKELLLIKRNKEPKKWSLIGGSGAFERAKDLMDMVQEEVLFDLNTTLKKINFIDCEYNNELIKLFFYGELKEKPIIGPEVSEIKWFSVDEIKNLDLAFKNDKNIIESFFKRYTTVS